MLARFARFAFSIRLSQAENERDLFLSGVFSAYRCVKMLVDIMSKLLFMNRRSDYEETACTKDIFEGPVENLKNIIDALEDNIDTEDKNDNRTSTCIIVLYTHILLSSLYEITDCSNMLICIFFHNNR